MTFFPSKRTLSCALVLGTALGISLPSYATNGYFLIGYGAKSRAMGGAGIAYGQDGLAAAANPATMVDVKVDTMRVDVGGELFSPPRQIDHNSNLLPADQIKSGSNLFLIPNMGMVYKFNRKMIIGFAAIGAGSNTRYDQSCSQRPAGTNGNFFNFNCNVNDPDLANSTVGVNLMQMQMLPSVAYKLSKNHTVGASLALAVQTFRAYGLGAFQQLGFSSGTSNVTDMGNDWSYGAGIRLGWLSKFFEKKVSVGVNYASRVYMTKFDKYKNLFAEQGGFDIPEHFGVGIAVHPTKKLTAAFDVQRIRYSSVRSIGNPGPVPALGSADFYPRKECIPPAGDSSLCKLGADGGLGFGWKDMTVYKVGVAYDYSAKWTFRAGYNYGKSPIRSDQILFNLLAPAVVEKHATLGLSYRPNQNIEWSVNYMHAFENEITGKTSFYPTGVNDFSQLTFDNAAASMKQDSLGISFAYKL